MRQLGIKTKDEILELGIEEVQRGLPRVGAEVHRRVARVRHPPGALGRLRQRLQDPRTRLHGVGASGRSRALRQGPGLRGLPGAALLLERRDAAVQPRAADGRRRLPEPAGPGGHRRVCRLRDRRAGAGLDDDAVDPAVQPGDRGRPGHRLRRGRVRRHGRDRALRPRRGAAARRTPASWARRLDRVVRAAQGHATSSAVATPRRSPTSSGHPNAHPGRRRPTSSPPTDGTGLVHIAGAFGEDDKLVTDRDGIEPVVPVEPGRPVHLPGRRLRGHARLRRQPADHRAPQGGHRTGADGGETSVTTRHRAAAPRDLRPLLPALLALPGAR